MSNRNIFADDEINFKIHRHHDFLVINDSGHHRLIPKSQILEISFKMPDLRIFLNGVPNSILMKTKPNDVGRLFSDLINWFDE